MSVNKRQILGIFLIAIGAILLLDKLDFIPGAFSWITRWYTILLIIGLYQFITGNRSTAFVLFIIGGVFLINDLEWFSMSWSYILPIVLVGVGALFLFRSSHPTTYGELSTEVFDSTSILGGTKHKVNANPLRGGRITCILGGAEVDMRKAVLTDVAVIDIFMVMGGAKITLPEHWDVQFEVNAILSGFEDKRDATPTAGAPRLIIRGTALMGGGELRS